MTDGQKTFLSFMKEICKENKMHELELILADCFGAQDNGTFDKEYLSKVTPRLVSVTKDEYLPQLEKAVASFAQKLG